MVLVESSNIQSIDYDPERNHLTINFHSGRSYRYEKVPQTVYDEFVNSESKGRYFNYYILGKYDTTRII